MDGWQAMQNWAIFCVAAGSLAYYYYPKGDRSVKPTSLGKDVKKGAKKLAHRAEYEKAASSREGQNETPEQDKASVGVAKNSIKKRKAAAQPAAQTTVAPAAAPVAAQEDDVDMSTRQFAASLQKAREGIQVKSTGSHDARVKTVKPKNSSAGTPVLSPDSSPADDDWSSAVSPALNASGVADMLEPAGPGPSALRITAPVNPAKEKVLKQAKKDVIETKKQRQNRKKKEDERLARLAMEKERKVLLEQQRRTAREASGLPAKNGISAAPAPADNPWAEQNAGRGAHLPVVDNSGMNVQLLDTLETESNSSSNQEASTAATSVAADPASSSFVDEGNMANALKESERESGWSEVKTAKKGKKKSPPTEPNGVAAPAAAKPAQVAPPARKLPGSTKPFGYQALTDEGELNAPVDSSDPSHWAA